MSFLNIEIKARTNRQDVIRSILNSQKAVFKGVDHQVDTYYNVPKGRLKLRKGNIENYLVAYEREDIKGPKSSRVTLYKTDSKSNLEEILANSLGILTIVDKKRERYFIDNVKFHLDTVSTLGQFVEIEAIDNNETMGKEKLLEQCNYYLELFKINKKDLIKNSYSDLLLKK